MKIGKLLISWDRGGLSAEKLRNVDDDYQRGLQNGKKLVLCTLAARSGTRWLGDIFNAHENATGITERYFEAESFYRYIKYNHLPIDTTGIIKLIKYGIVQDWKKADISLVISPFFSHGIKELFDILKPVKVIFGINDPKFTVQSIYNKGFFEHYYVRDNVDLALGFQPNFEQKWYWLYLFGRLVPNGDFYREWEKLTRIGKIAWWGSMVNRDIWNQLQTLPTDKVDIFMLKEADQNYDYYKKVVSEFGLLPVMSEKQFLAIKKKTVVSKHNVKHEWSDLEKKEFEKYAQDWYSLYNNFLTSKDEK